MNRPRRSDFPAAFLWRWHLAFRRQLGARIAAAGRPFDRVVAATERSR